MQIEESTSLCDIKFKIVFLGDMGVGKTSIIQRFVKNQFETANNPTIGIDFLCRNLTLQKKTYRLQLWDTAGQQKYKSLVPAYLRDAQCVVFVVDIAKKQSLPNLRGWLQLYKDQQPPNSITYLLANKSDLQNQRQIDKKQIEEFARQQEMAYQQVSAKTGEGVMESFQRILKKLHKPLDRKENIEDDNSQPALRFLQKFNRLKTQKDGNRMSCCYI